MFGVIKVLLSVIIQLVLLLYQKVKLFFSKDYPNIETPHEPIPIEYTIDADYYLYHYGLIRQRVINKSQNNDEHEISSDTFDPEADDDDQVENDDDNEKKQSFTIYAVL